jgi:predicted nucleic acid-binding Zn ribbon protein
MAKYGVGRSSSSERSEGSTKLAKQKTIPVPLADALTSYLKQAGITKRVQQAGIIEEWAELVGPQIASVTQPDSITPDGVLRVRVATAPWANELSLMSPKILARLNAGRSGRVKEIRWMPGLLERGKA